MITWECVLLGILQRTYRVARKVYAHF